MRRLEPVSFLPCADLRETLISAQFAIHGFVLTVSTFHKQHVIQAFHCSISVDLKWSEGALEARRRTRPESGFLVMTEVMVLILRLRFAGQVMQKLKHPFV